MSAAPLIALVFSQLSDKPRAASPGAEKSRWEKLRFIDSSARKCQVVPYPIPIKKLRKPRSLLRLRAVFFHPRRLVPFLPGASVWVREYQHEAPAQCSALRGLAIGMTQ